jgi:hypothetical protein
MDPEGDLSVLPQEMTLEDFESFITRLGKYPMQVNVLLFMTFFTIVIPAVKGLWCFMPLSTIFQLYRGG